MNNDFSHNIWVCGNRIPTYYANNTYYKIFDPFSQIDLININDINKYWSEYVCQYYVSANNLYSDVVTFCHDIRVVQSSKVDVARISEEDSFQYYFTTIDTRNRRHDQMGNLYIAPENVPDKNFLHIYHEIVTKMGQPTFMYDDCVEFLKRQNYVYQEDIHRIATKEPNIFITRECYSCTWNTFKTLQQYLLEYFEFIQNKYELHQDPKRHADFFLTAIVPHYVDTFKQVNGRLNFSHMLYQPRRMFDTIFNPEVNYGVDCRNNVYRLFSYIVELLISIFIQSRKHFYKSDCVKTPNS